MAFMRKYRLIIGLPIALGDSFNKSINDVKKSINRKGKIEADK